MNRSPNAQLLSLGALIGLGLAVAVAGCSEDPGTSSTSTSTTDSSSSSGSSSSSSSGGGGSGGGSSSSSSSSSSGSSGNPSLSFFVSSTGSLTGNLGGLAGADKRCQDLAAAVGAGAKTWHAYLSVETNANGQTEHAKDRIGKGPWYNAKLAMVAADVADLHTKNGDYNVFLDENGDPVNGQWLNSPKPNEHDILTGSNADGTVLAGKTCADWTSEDPTLFAQVGHSDGLGPMMNGNPPFNSWKSVDENGGCHDTLPKGGAGRVYCFATD